MSDLELIGGHSQPHLDAQHRTRDRDDSSAGEFTFGDFLDIINPLQHIPIVSTLYRAITGDEIRPHARILGDTLFGGPAGFLSSIVNVFYEEVAGEDIGETVLAFFEGGDGDEEPQFADGAEPAAVADNLAAAWPAPLETAASPADPQSSARLPEPPPGVLTGQDALNALFMDLRSSRPEEAALPPAARPAEGPTAKAYPLPPRPHHVPAAAAGPEASQPEPVATSEAVAHPLLFAQESAEGAIADRMMQALDKYRAMARANNVGGRNNKDDRQDERILWQSDPAATGS